VSAGGLEGCIVRGTRWLAVCGCVTALALALAGSAPTAAPKPAAQLIVTPFAASLGSDFGLGLVIRNSRKAAAPARVTLFVPAGYGVTASGSAGESIGEALVQYVTSASQSSPDFKIATMKRGDPASFQTDPCAPGIHAGVWIVTFKIGDQPVAIRFFVDPTQGADTSLGAFKLVACLASPYIPVDQGGAPAGVRFIELDLYMFGDEGSVFSNPTSAGTYVWRMLVTPYAVGTGTPDTAATFEARTRAVHPHVITEHAKYQLKTKTLLVSGRLRALGKPRAGIVVTFWAGKANGVVLHLLGRTRTRANGSYALRKRVRQQRRKQALQVFAEVAEIPGPCVDPPVAAAGCVDENLSPPPDGYVKVTIPKLRRPAR